MRVALIPDSEIAEKLKSGLIYYQRAIDNASDIAQEHISKISKVDEQSTSGSAEHKQSVTFEITKTGVTQV